YTQARRSDRFIKYRDKTFKERRIVFADANIFDVFTIPFLKGDPVTALTEPHTVVISGKTAQKYFGNEDPIGKVLTFDGSTDYEVTGVFRDIEFLQNDGNAFKIWHQYQFVALRKPCSS
ncbi:unnamed protein product, partial [marine sediment metagenome]